MGREKPGPRQPSARPVSYSVGGFTEGPAWLVLARAAIGSFAAAAQRKGAAAAHPA